MEYISLKSSPSRFGTLLVVKNHRGAILPSLDCQSRSSDLAEFNLTGEERRDEKVDIYEIQLQLFLVPRIYTYTSSLKIQVSNDPESFFISNKNNNRFNVILRKLQLYAIYECMYSLKEFSTACIRRCKRQAWRSSFSSCSHAYIAFGHGTSLEPSMKYSYYIRTCQYARSGAPVSLLINGSKFFLLSAEN